MSVSESDIRIFVVKPALIRLGAHTQAAENLVYGTGLVESQYKYLDQITPGPGPAYGFWQMEKLTHDDLWQTFLPYQPSNLSAALKQMAGEYSEHFPSVETLHWNLLYAAAMCRIRYMRVREALPAANDAQGMAAYWKRYYNTPKGAGSVEHALPFFQQAITP